MNQRDIDNIPQQLRHYPHWVCYKLIDKGEPKLSKVPYDPKTGRPAKANDPKTWGTFEQACKVAKNGKYDGIGFEFSDNDPFTGVDLDHCVKDGVILPWAQDIINRLNSYSEFSPSGTGVHIYVEAIKPIGRCKKGDIEIYVKGRFLTITGKLLPDTPATIEKRQGELNKFHAEVFGNHSSRPTSKANQEPATTLSLSDAELIDMAMDAKNSAKFKALWNGDTSGYGKDDSAADMALCGMLAFWTNKDHDRIDFLFRQSSLMRDKWDRRTGEQTYGDLTISKAIDGCMEVYKGKNGKPSKQDPSRQSGNKQTLPENTIPEYQLTHRIESTPENISKLVNFNCTEAGNAELFRDLFGDTFCYVPELGCWLNFDGVKWIKANEDARLTMLAIVRKRIDAAQLSLLDPKQSDLRNRIIRWSLSSESNAKLRASLEIAQCMLTKPFMKFDKDPYLLCVENGVIDLRVDGEGFRKARPEDYLYKCTNIKYDPGAKCPRWERFQDEVTLNDQDMIQFKKKVYGYTLTGQTTEQCLFLYWGCGANGKSTELGIAEKLLGDYALSTPASTFKEQYGNDGIPNDIARMAGMRLVKTIEIKEGVRLNEERIKSLTGGDRISARFLHKEFFDYWPEYKLWLATNHKPIIKGTDEAIWRRIRLIPFDAHFPPEKRDPDLLNTLQSELPGILLWAIEGCYFWQREGLKPIDKIEKATNEYRQESDVIERFIYERINRIEGTTLKASLLYKAYQKWCEDSGEKLLNSTEFGLRMVEKGFMKEKKSGNVIYYDIQISN